MHHLRTTLWPPEVETGDGNLQSEILAIFRLGSVPGWVYMAMTGDKELELYDDVEALIADCPVVVREDTSIKEWNEEYIVLSMGTGYPTFYKALGTEFLQILRCLSYPPTFHSTPHAFSVGEWVCIARPGTYWGDIGLIWSLSDEEDEERITVLLVP
jgi:hypothetical protein